MEPKYLLDTDGLGVKAPWIASCRIPSVIAVICICMLNSIFSTSAIASKSAAETQTFSGVFSDFPIRRCSEKMADAATGSGAPIFPNCYTGDAFGPGPVLRLVRNGLNICGWFDAFEDGPGKMYAGRVVGQLATPSSTTVDLSWEDGFSFGGKAEVLRVSFVTRNQVAVEREDRNSPFRLVRRESRLLATHSLDLCKPRLIYPVLLPEGRLNVEGLPDIEPNWFTPLKSHKFAARPPTKILILTDKAPIGTRYRDTRKEPDFQTRPVKIINKSRTEKHVQINAMDACYHSYNELAPWTEDINVREPITIRPQETVVLATCNGSGLETVSSNEVESKRQYVPAYNPRWRVLAK